MTKVNAYTIQEKIRKESYISVPWIQRKFALSYKDAVNFLNLLIKRGWIAGEAEGIRYAVHEENLKLRKIRRDEIDIIIADITLDCIPGLLCILRHVADGATYEEMREAIRGEEDTEKTIGILRKNNLIYEFDGVYFSCISNKTFKVLVDVVKHKREIGESQCERPDEVEKMRKLFDPLFSEE